MLLHRFKLTLQEFGRVQNGIGHGVFVSVVLSLELFDITNLLCCDFTVSHIGSCSLSVACL